MKINTITHKRFKRSPTDIPRTTTLKDPTHHPFIQQREYVRALNAVKIERMLSKPFVCALSHHKEGIASIARHPEKDLFATSGYDGQVLLFDTRNRSLVCEAVGSCGVPRAVGFVDDRLLVSENNFLFSVNAGLKNKSEFSFKSESHVIDFKYGNDLIYSATQAGVDIFTSARSNPVYSHRYLNVKSIDCSPLEMYCIATGTETMVGDHRTRKIFLNLKGCANQVRFSRGTLLAEANEDGTVTIRDMRNAERVMFVFRHHLNSATSVDFSPDGALVASGSFDRTLRLFSVVERRCTDVYYNKRMHNINAVAFDCSGRIVLSGSDDGCLRMWRSDATDSGVKSARQKNAVEYSRALIEKYESVEEVKRIRNHRFLPKMIKNKIKRRVEKANK